MLEKLGLTALRLVQPGEQVDSANQGQLPGVQEQVETTSRTTASQPLADLSKTINPAFVAQQAIKNKEQALVLLKEVQIKTREAVKEWSKASSETNKLYKKCDDFARRFPRLFIDFKLLPGDITPVVRCFRERQGKDIDISSLSEEDKKEFFNIRESANEVNKMWEEAEKSTQKVRQEVRAFFEEKKEQYPNAIDSLRLDSPIERKNIKVVAAISQLSSAVQLTPTERDNGETVSLHARNFSGALKTTNSMDEAIDKVCKDAHVFGEDKVEPGIQKAVCSKNNNVNAWRKLDNDNPNVKRFVISIVAGDGGKLFSKEQEELLGLYEGKDKQYRVDKIEMVSAPTEEEKERGITFKEKIEDAFRKARLFVEEETRKNPGQKLKFEGIVHWHGHGTSLTDKLSPEDKIECHDEHGTPLTENIKLEDEISYKEGSLGFLFITRHLYNSGVEGIDKTAIKRIEQENLGEYRYFIHDFHSCCSGAMIA